MDELPNAVPSDDEKRAQLERIVSLSGLATRSKAKELFEFVVHAALHGKTPREEEIRSSVFPSPPYKPDTTNVRTNMNTVRKLVKEYYDRPDNQDPVIISLPKIPKAKAARDGNAEAYSVNFAYRERYGPELLLRTALKALERWTPNSARFAFFAFRSLLDEIGYDYEVMLAQVHCTCIVATYLTTGQSKKELIETAIMMGRLLVERRPDDWRSHQALGAACICDGSVLVASDAMKKASSLNPTLSAPGYLGSSLSYVGSWKSSFPATR